MESIRLLATIEEHVIGEVGLSRCLNVQVTEM
jgi:hypothetical protein